MVNTTIEKAYVVFVFLTFTENSLLFTFNMFVSFNFFLDLFD